MTNYTIQNKAEIIDVREKVASYGYIEHMTNEELLAAYLTIGSKTDGKEEADNLFSNIDIANFADLDFNRLVELGLSKNKAIGLLALVELTKRSARTNLKGDAIMSSFQIANRLQTAIGSEKQEVVYVIYLDNQNKIIEEKRIFVGAVNQSLANPQVILHHACRNLATSIIVSHNHPSGCIKPSENDNRFTQRLRTSCDSLGITLLDHIIVTKEDYFSYREKTNYLH